MPVLCHDDFMATVRMGDEVDFLHFDIPDRDPHVDPTDEFPTEIEAQLRLGELRAGVQVSRNYASGFADLVAYFDGLERDWRGWAGIRRWQSLDGELAIEARHDGHVQFEIRLERAMWWTASGELTVEPGEQLSQVAAGLRRAFAGA